MAYTTFNLLNWTDRQTVTNNGVTYTYNGDGTFTCVGTATDTASNNIYIGSIANCPLRPGDTYYGIYSAAIVRFRIDFYTSATVMDNSTRISYYLTLSSGSFTVPSNTIGIQIRIYAQQGRTVNETVSPSVVFAATGMTIGQICSRYAMIIADDDRFHYYDSSQGESNLGAWTYDCATYNSFTFYLAMEWTDWPSSSHGSIGYFWPYISQTGFDTFLLVNGWQRYPYNQSLLTEGAIIITDETLHHSLMYIGSNQLCDANNYFGYGANSIAIRSFPTYSTGSFAFIYLPPDIPAPAGQGRYVPWYRHQRRGR